MEEAAQGAEREAEHLALGDRSLELVAREDTPQVEDRSRRRGRWNALAGRRCLRSQARRAVDPDALSARSPSVAGHRDVHRRLHRLEHPPVHRGGAMAQHGSLAARQDRAHPPPLVAEVPVSHRIHPAVNAVQTPRLDANLDRPIRKSRRKQLRHRDYAVLSRGNACGQVVGRGVGGFCTHTVDKAPRPSGCPYRGADPSALLPYSPLPTPRPTRAPT